MKIQILTYEEKLIDGFLPIITDENGNLEISDEISDNSISCILLEDVLERIPYESFDNIFTAIKKLIRIGGDVYIKGTDARYLSTEFLNHNIDLETYNSILFNKSAIYTASELCEKLKNIGLQINMAKINGVIYDIHGSRQA